jgi:hypothetical protein
MGYEMASVYDYLESGGSSYFMKWPQFLKIIVTMQIPLGNFSICTKCIFFLFFLHSKQTCRFLAATSVKDANNFVAFSHGDVQVTRTREPPKNRALINPFTEEKNDCFQLSRKLLASRSSRNWDPLHQFLTQELDSPAPPPDR